VWNSRGERRRLFERPGKNVAPSKRGAVSREDLDNRTTYKTGTSTEEGRTERERFCLATFESGAYAAHNRQTASEFSNLGTFKSGAVAAHNRGTASKFFSLAAVETSTYAAHDRHIASTISFLYATFEISTSATRTGHLTVPSDLFLFETNLYREHRFYVAASGFTCEAVTSSDGAQSRLRCTQWLEAAV
jgi:hypothetical protein